MAARGNPREIRLPGAGQSPELNAALMAFGSSFFPRFLLLMMAAAMVEEVFWLRHWGVQRLLGPWTILGGRTADDVRAGDWDLDGPCPEHARWDGQFFLPAGMVLVFAVAFGAVGWSLRGEK